ncbi:MAG: hypothetical protein HYT80_04930 [Euryarchaeota archaeon]|nr:hypothetical protein [Euryarchaeota archaeon]
MGPVLAALAVSSLLAAGSGTAQVPTQTGSYVDFQILAEKTFGFVVRGGTGRTSDGAIVQSTLSLSFGLKDLSFDAEPGTGTQGTALAADYMFLSETWFAEAPSNPPDFTKALKDPPPGWFGDAQEGAFIDSRRGETTTFEAFIGVLPNAEAKEAFYHVQIKMQGQSPRRDLVAYRNLTFGARIMPQPGLQVDMGFAGTVRPNTWVTIPIVVANTDLYQQKVDVSLVIEDGEDYEGAGLAQQGSGSYVLEPLESKPINLTFLTPKSRMWFRSEAVQYQVRVVNTLNPAISQTSSSVVIVDGFYFSRQLVLIIPILILLIVLFLWLLIAGKRYYDERVLGKPIAPWKIPQEADRLEVMRKEDPRNFYVTRHFLMREEYESALLWFYSFKKRNSRRIKNEAASAKYRDRASQLATPSLVRFDRKAERLRRRFQRRQERQRLKLEAKLEALQGKLDQHYEADHDKDHRKWEEKVEKLQKKANRPWFREHKKWEKQVEKALAAWETPFKKDKAKHEKAVAKILEKHEKRVKKKDKPAWKEWKVAAENMEKENELREKEGREPLPLPELRSEEVEYPELPAPFKTPPKPKLPPEPVAPKVKDLPAEPELVKPKLEDSHYARKTRRAKRKTDRKVRRLEKKLNRLLARNERDRVRAIAKADRKRRKLNRKSQVVLEPTITQKILRLTPEDRERRAQKKLLRSLAKEKVKAVEENEKARLEVLEVEAQRREAELMAKIIRSEAEVRKSGGSAAARVEGGTLDEASLEELRADNVARIEKERAKSQARVQAERVKAEKELQAELAEELIKERLGPEPAAPGAAKATEPEQAPKKPRRK